MKKIYLSTAFLLLTLAVSAQDFKKLDGKWAFSGSRMTIFTVRNDTLFTSLIDDSDLNSFDAFYAGKPISDPKQLIASKVSSFNGKLMISADFSTESKSHLLTLIYDEKDSLHIQYVGDVYYNDKKVPYTNENCNPAVPYCTNRLYSKSDLAAIKKMAPLAGIKKPEILELFKRHEEVCKTKCNKCYESFAGAEINEILIDMGYNPINKVEWNKSYKYSVSGFDFIMDHNKQDPEIMAAYKKYSQPFYKGKDKDEAEKKDKDEAEKK
jgi:hypothetical protein